MVKGRHEGRSHSFALPATAFSPSVQIRSDLVGQRGQAGRPAVCFKSSRREREIETRVVQQGKRKGRVEQMEGFASRRSMIVRCGQ